MLDFLKSAEVQTALAALTAGCLATITGVIVMIGLQARAALKAWFDAQLIKHGLQSALNMTTGLSAGEPVPAAKLPELIARTREYIEAQAPERPSALNGLSEKIVARVDVAGGTAGTIGAAIDIAEGMRPAQP